MKNINTILIIILLLAVGYLLVDKFSAAPEELSQTETIIPTEENALRIASINMDSLNSGFQFIADQTEILEAEAKRVQINIQNKYKKAEKRNTEIQQSTPENQAQLDALQKELYDLQTNLQNYEQAQSSKLQNMQLDLQDQIKLALDTCLMPYREQYDFIFSYGAGSEMIYSKEAHDISATLIEVMNYNYQESLTKKEEE